LTFDPASPFDAVDKSSEGPEGPRYVAASRTDDWRL